MGTVQFTPWEFLVLLAALMECDVRYYEYMKMFVHRNETRQERYKDCILWCIFIFIVLYMEGGAGNKGNK